MLETVSRMGEPLPLPLLHARKRGEGGQVSRGLMSRQRKPDKWPNTELSFT